ncbi:MAG: HAMP domain-containing histidine kinase [Anaerolineales bacterium]|uniref:sensor histidine kinase n=1 Tax=Candidatus Villigracilis vicinus TaxID=3140679 RepID=UPI00313517F2|nr:HAMP domain-containing histidine kinase [Anaerolineales bacterium]
MISSLRSRLWLSYAFIVVTALSVVTIVLFVSLFQNPLLYRQTTERLKAVQSVITERSKEDQSPPLSTLAERSARTFNVRVILLSKNREVTFDSAFNGETALAFPENRRVLRTLPIVRDENGNAWLYSIEKLPDGTFLMVTTPRPRISILNIVSDDFMPIIWSGGIIALLLSLVVAFLISGWIANPLQRVVNAAREMPSAEVKPVEVAGPHEVQELTRAFNSMLERVQASGRSQRDFVANVSHEMKTPLTSIQGFAQALLDGTADTDESRQKAAQVIFGESERMHRMVLDLLDLAKLDAGTADLKMSAVNMRVLLTSIQEKFTPQSQRAEVKIELQIPADLPPLIADGDRMAQVFTNLTDNALKFTPRGGTVSLAARVEMDGMCITVTDTGAGIPEADLPYIFRRFYQVDPARKGGETHGAGLGLAIAHEIVAAHGGRITVRSREGAGTTMEVLLPLSPPEKTQTVRKK